MAIRFLLRLSFISWLILLSLGANAKTGVYEPTKKNFKTHIKEFFYKKKSKKEFRKRLKNKKRQKIVQTTNSGFLGFLNVCFGIGLFLLATWLIIVSFMLPSFLLFILGVLVYAISVVTIILGINRISAASS